MDRVNVNDALAVLLKNGSHSITTRAEFTLILRSILPKHHAEEANRHIVEEVITKLMRTYDKEKRGHLNLKTLAIIFSVLCKGTAVFLD